MDLIKNVSVTIMISCIISVILEFLVPVGTISKIFNTVLSLFVICALIYPIKNNFKLLNLDEILCQNQMKINNNTEFTENINNQILKVSKDKIKELILDKLKEAQILPEKVEIFMDINTYNCIEIIRAKIYINKKYEFLIPKIKSEVDNNFKILTEIIVI